MTTCWQSAVVVVVANVGHRDLKHDSRTVRCSQLFCRWNALWAVAQVLYYMPSLPYAGRGWHCNCKQAHQGMRLAYS